MFMEIDVVEGKAVRDVRVTIDERRSSPKKARDKLPLVQSRNMNTRPGVSVLQTVRVGPYIYQGKKTSPPLAG